MTGWKKKLLITLATAALPSFAWAQQDTSKSGVGAETPPAAESTPTPSAPAENLNPVQPENPAPAYTYSEPTRTTPRAYHHGGASFDVQANAGMLNFVGGVAADLNPGLAYGVGASILAPQAIGLELGYQGAAYGTKSAVPGPRESVVENGGQALLKLGPHLPSVEPYVMGGYNLSYVSVANRSGSAGVVRDDAISKVPVGAGIDFHLRGGGTTSGLLLGVRSSYNFLFSNQAYSLVADSNGTRNRSGDQLITTLDLGGHF